MFVLLEVIFFQLYNILHRNVINQICIKKINGQPHNQMIHEI